MKKQLLAFCMFALSSTAFADIPLHMQCYPVDPNGLNRGRMSAHVTLLAGGLAQGTIDSLTYVNEYNQTLDYSMQLRLARPEVGYEYGEGATGLTFEFPEDRGPLDKVVLILEQDMRSMPKTSDADLVIRRKHGFDLKARMVCIVGGNE